MWPFKSKPKVGGKDVDQNGFVDNAGFQQQWIERGQPTPGAMSYAFVSLGLPAFSTIGPGIAALGTPRPVAIPYYSLQAVPIVGIPLQAGQIFGQPLVDPDAPNNSGIVTAAI